MKMPSRRFVIRSTLAFSVLLLFLAFWHFRSPPISGLTPFPTGSTTIAYVGQEVLADGKPVAVFTFSNGQGRQVSLVATVITRHSTNETWDQSSPVSTNRFRIPHRQTLTMRFPPPSAQQWKVRLNAYEDPTPFEELGNTISRATGKRGGSGGLMGAWATPVMQGAAPARQQVTPSP